MAATDFKEANLSATPIRNLGLTIAGTSLEPILAEFAGELQRAGIRRLKPRFYLSTEWGVPFGTVAIAIPFYLASPELTALQAERVGYVEGTSRTDILRFLRHEMGHVVNYAYQLYEQAAWIQLFGSIEQPYEEEYRPEPFSRRYVRHLHGSYAQKHPDEDWAETFAVWMTPGLDWRRAYAHWPVALAKLDYCERTLDGLADLEPLATSTDLDEDVGELTYSVDQYYRDLNAGTTEFPPELDADLRTILEDFGQPEDATNTAPRRPASALIRRVERDLMAEVYRWTGHFPERTRLLLRYLAERADQLKQVYPEDREVPVVVALTTLVTALAMHYTQRGSYVH